MQRQLFELQPSGHKGGSPGVVVSGDDSCSRGRGFESRCVIYWMHFFTLICCKNSIVCLKRPKINEKEAEVGPFLKKNFRSVVAAQLVEKLFPTP